jgi:hypothetical protein
MFIVDEPVTREVVIDGLTKVLLVSDCVAVNDARVYPPRVYPSCTLTVLLVTSNTNSPTAPVKASFCVDVPLLNCI